MNINMKMGHCSFVLLTLVILSCLITVSANQIEPNLWQAIQKAPSNSLNSRVDYFSKLFLGLPYGKIDYEQPENINSIKDIEKYLFKPEYSVNFTRFDCVVFVETVLALSLANNDHSLQKFEHSFMQMLKSIRYLSSNDAYIYRNHFQSIDWNFNNAWLVTDITDQFSLPCHMAKCNINKPSWLFNNVLFKKFLDENSTNKITEKKNAILRMLKKHKVDYVSKESKVKYLSIKDIVENEEKIYSSFPDVAIINIIRPNWDIKKFIGTNLNISHVGFVIKRNGLLLFRHASSKNSKTVKELPLTDYLKQFIDNPTIKGINVLALSSKKTIYS